MTTEVATAYIAIGASTTGLGRAANRTFSASIGNAASAASAFASRLLAPVAIATAAAGVGRFFATAVNRGSDLAETSTALSAVFGDAVAVVNDFAAAAPTALGQARQQVAEAAQMFGVYGNAAGLASNDSATFSTELVTMATDLASFYNTSPADAVEAISAGLRGEAEPLRKYGILLSDAALKAEAIRQGIYDGNGPLDQQARILAAQALVLQQGGIASGDFARTSSGLANQTRILAAVWTDFTAQIGTALLPAVTSVVTVVNRLAGPALEALAGTTQGGVDWLTEMFTGDTGVLGTLSASVLDSLPSIIDGFLSALVRVVPELLATASEVGPGIIAGLLENYPQLVAANIALFGGIVAAASTVIPQVATSLGDLMPTLLGALDTLVPQLLAGAVEMFSTITAAIPLIVPPLQAAFAAVVPGLIATVLGMVPTLLDTGLSLFDGLVTGVLEALPTLLDTLLGSQAALIGAILTMLPSLVDAALTLFLGLTVGLLDALPTLLTGILDMLPDVLGQILAMLPALTDTAVMLFTGLVEAFPQILPELIGAVSEIVPMLLDTVVGLAPVLFDMGRQIVEGLAAGLAGSAAAVAESLVGSVGNAVDAFTDMLGINSPSTVMAEVGAGIAASTYTAVESRPTYAPEPSPEYLSSQRGGITLEDIARAVLDGVERGAVATDGVEHTTAASSIAALAGRRHLRAVS